MRPYYTITTVNGLGYKNYSDSVTIRVVFILSSSSLFVAQRVGRVDARGLQCGQDGGEQ